jgi:hypothetical protein
MTQGCKYCFCDGGLLFADEMSYLKPLISKYKLNYKVLTTPSILCLHTNVGDGTRYQS